MNVPTDDQIFNYMAEPEENCCEYCGEQCGGDVCEDCSEEE